MFEYCIYEDDGSWWIRFFKWGIVCRPATAFKSFSERTGHKKWFYIGKYKYIFKRY